MKLNDIIQMQKDRSNGVVLSQLSIDKLIGHALMREIEAERLTQALADKDLALIEQTEIAQAANRQAEAYLASALVVGYAKASDLEKLAQHHNGFAVFLSLTPRPNWVALVAQKKNVQVIVAPIDLSPLHRYDLGGDGACFAPNDGSYVLYDDLVELLAAPQQHAQAAQSAPAQPIAGELPPLPRAPEEVAYGYKSNYDGTIREVLLHSGGPLVKYREVPLVTVDQMHAYATTYGHQCRAAALEEAAKIAETPIAGEQDDITMAAKDRVSYAIRALNKTEG